MKAFKHIDLGYFQGLQQQNLEFVLSIHVCQTNLQI